MMTQLIELDFSTPQPIDLSDKVNLKNIYLKLVELGGLSENTTYRQWARTKLTHYTENIDYLTEVFKNPRKNSRGASLEKVHISTVRIALQIIANGHGKPGHQMRCFLTDCLEMKANPQERDLSDILIEAGHAFKKEQALRIRAERDRSKIGDRKVATAMATASTAVRRLKKSESENEFLRERLYESES